MKVPLRLIHLIQPRKERTFRDVPSSVRYMLGVEAISSFFILALYR
jgi:hypothetical protein